jgi:GMP synthase-like glutamine amidotransferase
VTYTVKSLLVNCSLNGKVGADLLVALGKFSELKVVNFGEVTSNYQIANDIEAVVISGSVARIVNPVDRAKFEGVELLIKNCSLPILGICFGHQLLCWAFGAEVETLPQQVDNRFEDVKVVQSNEIFSGFKEGQPIPLAENHYDYVLKDSLDSTGFTLLADSASCEVEAVKHQTKPFYGVQFHPERITIKDQTHPEGHKILDNFYYIVKRLGISGL